MNKIGIIGTGYVGIPLIFELAKKIRIVAYDIDESKIQRLKTNNNNSNVEYTLNPAILHNCNTLIVTVPTPVDDDNKPDLSCIKNACKTIGKIINKNTLVIFESSYMPGTTNDVCIPLIEKYSKLICNRDFFVGYSPERINTLDKEHNLSNIVKIIAADDKETLDRIEKVYSLIEDLTMIKASNIKIAELSKMVENTQRDINIGFINEIAILCHSLGLDSNELLKLASTKWNFYNVTPGLIGGHCISVDPYYLINCAQKNNVDLRITKVSREVNEDMSMFLVNSLLSLLPKNIDYSSIKIGILGYSYKKNSDDIRNTKIKKLKTELCNIGFNVIISDYIVKKEFDNTLSNLDVLIVGVDHDAYCSYTKKQIYAFFDKKRKKKIIMDTKSIYCKYTFAKDYIYWSL